MDPPRNPDNTNEGSGIGGRPVSSDGFIDMSRGLQRRPYGALARSLAATSQMTVPMNTSATPSPSVNIPPIRQPTFIYPLPTNSDNRRGKNDNPCRHRGSRYPPFVHRRKLEIILKRFPNCLDMYKRLKVGKDGTYFDINGAEIEAQLEAALRALQENGQAITEAEDLEASAPILGYSQRTGLPFVVGHAATMVPGSRFQSISSQENVTSQSTSQSFGLSQDTIALVTQMAHQFEDLRAVVAAQAQQLHYLQHGKSTTPSGSFDDDEVSSDEDSD